MSPVWLSPSRPRACPPRRVPPRLEALDGLLKVRHATGVTSSTPFNNRPNMILFGPREQRHRILLAGICLGPSVFGAVAPNVSAYLLSPTIFPVLNIVAQLGVILYLFLVGLELDTRVIHERGPAALVIAHASIVVPFLFGAVLALVEFLAS